MGKEIKSTHFTQEDYEQFQKRLEVESNFLKHQLGKQNSTNYGIHVGFELEAWLVDNDFLPSPMNDRFLKKLADPSVTYELSRYNIEFNSPHYELSTLAFFQLKADLEKTWFELSRLAKSMGHHVISIGTLPTLSPSMLDMEFMTQSQRYQALNQQILKQRGGEPLHIHIEGKDTLKLDHHNVMLESCATSLQIHVMLPVEQAAKLYNCACIISAPMVALTANSPFLFQKSLWDETRIPVFEQAVELKQDRTGHLFPPGRVSFGDGYLQSSICELFEENLQKYPILIPHLSEDSIEMMSHLKFHNGCIWRWNRPLVDYSPEGQIQLRLEHRAIPAGESIDDIMANICFFVGLLYGLAQEFTLGQEPIPFFQARNNFYEAARDGLTAKLHWAHGRTISVQRLLEDNLLSIAKDGLKIIGVSQDESDYFLNGVILPRLKEKQNGAQWQRRFIERHGNEFNRLVEKYHEQQDSQKPVHQWKVS